MSRNHQLEQQREMLRQLLQELFTHKYGRPMTAEERKYFFLTDSLVPESNLASEVATTPRDRDRSKRQK